MGSTQLSKLKLCKFLFCVRCVCPSRCILATFVCVYVSVRRIGVYSRTYSRIKPFTKEDTWSRRKSCCPSWDCEYLARNIRWAFQWMNAFIMPRSSAVWPRKLTNCCCIMINACLTSAVSLSLCSDPVEVRPIDTWRRSLLTHALMHHLVSSRIYEREIFISEFHTWLNCRTDYSRIVLAFHLTPRCCSENRFPFLLFL